MKFGELKKHLDSCLGGDKFCAAYIVTGDDDYLVSSAIKSFKNLVAPEYADFNLSVLSGDGALSAAVDSAYTFPVFDERKVVVLSLENALGESDKNLLDKYLAEPSDTTVLVISCSEDVAKTIKSKKAQTVDCSKLAGDELHSMIERLCNEPPSISIERAAVGELVDRTQGNMSRIVSEIAKLKSYSQNTITKQDVCDMVSADIDFQIYELANAVSDKDANKAIEVLDVFFKNGIRGVTIINRLYDKYRNMLHAELNKNLNNEELGKLLGMKSGAVYFLRKTSSNYSQVRLKKCVDYLHSLQCDVLTGARNDLSAIHEAILQLLTI